MSSLSRIIVDLVNIFVGCLCILFRKSFASFAMEQQNKLKFWGRPYGQEEIEYTKIIILICGIVFVLFGLLSLCGVIRYKI